MNHTKYKYLTHATKSDEAAKKICEEWLKYQEWRANISGDLVHNLTYTKEGGQREKEHKPEEGKKISKVEEREKTPDITHIIILRKPTNKLINYGNTSILEENHEKKSIKWYPRVWRWGRLQLAIFDSKSKINALTSNKKENFWIQMKVANESENGDYTYLDKENVLLDYIPSPTYKQTIEILRKQIRKLEKIDVTKYIKKICEELEKSKGYKKGWINIQEIWEELFFSTIEQQITRLIRTCYILSKKYIWYTIQNGQEEEEIDPFESEIKYGEVVKSREVVIQEFLERIKLYKEKVNQQDFDIIGNNQLNRYIRTSINKIYQEIEQYRFNNKT